MRSRLLLLIHIVGCCSSLLAQNGFTVSGTVGDAVTKLSIPNLAVRLIPPKESTRPEIDTITDTTGAFSFRPIPTGRYLLEIDSGLTPVYRDVIGVTGDTHKQVLLVTATTIAQDISWRPADLTSNGSDIYVLQHDAKDKDHPDGISKIRADSAGSQLVTVVSLPNGYDFSSIAAAPDAIFVTGNNELGCTVIQYQIGTASLTRRLFSAIMPVNFCK